MLADGLCQDCLDLLRYSERMSSVSLPRRGNEWAIKRAARNYDGNRGE